MFWNVIRKILKSRLGFNSKTKFIIEFFKKKIQHPTQPHNKDNPDVQTFIPNI